MPRLVGNRLPSTGSTLPDEPSSRSTGVKSIWGPTGQASRLEYDRVVAEWMANGRSFPALQPRLS